MNITEPNNTASTVGLGVEPDAWATKIMCIGPEYGKTFYGKLPMQSLNPLFYSHERLYSEKAVIGLMKAAYSDGYAEREQELRAQHNVPLERRVSGLTTRR